MTVTNDSSAVWVMGRSKQIMWKQEADYNTASDIQGTLTHFAGKPGWKTGKQVPAKQNLNPDDNNNNDPVYQAVCVGQVCCWSFYYVSCMPCKATTAGARQHCYKPGTRALMEITYYQHNLGPYCSKICCFMSYLTELRKIFAGRWIAMALQEGMEDYLVGL